MTDEELQNKMEKGFKGQNLEERAYRTVFDALEKEPSFKLSSRFADSVIERHMLAVSKSTSRELVWLYIGLASFVIAAGVCVAITGFRFNLGVLKFISGYPGLFVFGALFVLGLQWIDKKLVRPSMGENQ